MSASELEQSDCNVRGLATDILAKVETRNAYADILLDGTLRSAGLSRRDGALLTELTYGTLRWRGRIDAQLKLLMRRGLESADPFIRNLLRATLYQIDFLDRIPDYAAVNGAVDLAKSHGGERAAGFVNALLRRYLRERAKKPPAPPDCARASLAEISDYWSHPQWLVQQWREYVGAAEVAPLLEANNQAAQLVVRTNLLRTTRAELLEILRRGGVAAEPTTRSPQGIVIRSGLAVDQLPAFQQGLFQVQGEASQLVGYLLEPGPGERILDACAAPGGKATHLAELAQDRAEIVATDISQRGLKKLQENATRLGLRSISALLADASSGSTTSGDLYDRILVDAPCSGLGTLRAHPEIKWRRSPADIKRLSRLQQAILTRSAAQLKTGGVLVYSTCTLTAEENERVVEKFLQNCDSFILEDAAARLPAEAKSMARNRYYVAWPHRHDTDGFFAARFKKVAA